MKVYRDISEINKDKDTIITIGTFDGVHLGHRKLLSFLKERSKKLNLRSFVATFDPHPRFVVSKDNGIKLLSTLEEKTAAFDKLGIENLLIINFTKGFSELTSEEFLRGYIIEGIGLREFIVGYDHKFGRHRKGDREKLVGFGKKYGFDVSVVQGVYLNGHAVSSTFIRNLLLNGDVKSAAGYLGYTYSISGRVVQGAGRGRGLGFPTANIIPSNSDKLIPSNGVYAVECAVSEKKYFGIMNIGLRPTFENRIEPVLEVHIFDFKETIYSMGVTINFIDRIRNEKRFSSKDELIKQINQDIEKAYSIIGNLVN